MKTNRKLLSVLSTLFVLCLLLTSLPISASAAELKINATEVTIYALDEETQKVISIPEEYPQSFTFSVSGASNVTCYGSSGSKIDIKGTTVKPYITTYYWYGMIGYSAPIEGKTPSRITNEVDFGKYSAVVKADGKTWNVTVNVVDYAETYAEKTARAYLDKNIKSGMSTKQKLEIIAAFVANKEYNAKYSSFVSMMLYGGGDCWASTDTIVTMSKMLGMNAWVRNGNADAGAGSGHKNAMVSDGKKYYMVEAGYNMPVPRDYEITERDSLFSFRYNSKYKGYEVYQFDGETVPEKITVPKTYKNEPVVSVGNNFLAGAAVKEVVLPSTIKRIGRRAFSGCEKLETINIPNSVEEVGELSFTNCFALKKVTATGRVRYKDGAFILDNTVLLCVPSADKYTVPEGITTILDYAFSHNPNLTEVNLASTVTTLGEGCFYNCNALKTLNIKDNSVTTIGKYIFADCSLREVYLPASVTNIDEEAAVGCEQIIVYGHKGTAAEKFANENDNVKFVNISNAKKGDVDLNGKVNIQDCTALQRYLAEMIKLNASALKCADVNGDNRITIADVTKLQRVVAEYDKIS